MEPEIKIIELSDKDVKTAMKKKKKNEYNEERNWRYIKNQLELPELKSIIFEMRTSLDYFNSRLDWRRKDQWIWRHNDRNYPIWNWEWEKKLRWTVGQYQADIHVIGVPEGKEREEWAEKNSWRNNG